MTERFTLRNGLATVGVTPVTPFSGDLSAVDAEGLRANLEFLVESGVTLIYPAGNTGESMSLSASEWTTVVDIAMSVAGGRATVLPGIGHDYPTAVELARRAATMGVDGLLAMPRTQPHATSQGLLAYWRALAEASGLPLVVYKKDIPDPDDLVELLSHESIAGCKYAERDLSRFAQAREDGPDDIVWTCGLAERYAPFFWEAGARGFTSGLANFAPSVAQQMLRSLEEGDMAQAMAVRARCLDFEELRAEQSDAYNVAAVKVAMDTIGLAGGRVRPPLIDLDADASHRARALAQEMTSMMMT